MCFHFTAPLVEKPSKLAPNGFERTPNGCSSDLQLAPTTNSTISVESYWNCFTEPPLLATNRFSLGTLGRLLAEREGSDVRTYLMKHRAVVVRYRDTDGVSALHVACEMGREAAVRVLCEELHMSIEVTDSLGRSPLFLASARGHVAVVRYLVESQGADVCSSYRDGWTCFHYAHAHVDLLRYLLSLVTPAADSTLLSAPTSRTSDGCTPLLLACKAGVLETVRLLLEFAPGELLGTDHNGVSCLSFACWKGHVDVVKLLLSQPLYQQQQRDTNPANNQPLHSKPMNHLNQQSKCGYTCLHYACVGGHGEIARLLVEAGVDETVLGIEGTKPVLALELCSSNSCRLTVERALQRRAGQRQIQRSVASKSAGPAPPSPRRSTARKGSSTRAPPTDPSPTLSVQLSPLNSFAEPEMKHTKASSASTRFSTQSQGGLGSPVVRDKPTSGETSTRTLPTTPDYNSASDMSSLSYEDGLSTADMTSDETGDPEGSKSGTQPLPVLPPLGVLGHRRRLPMTSSLPGHETAGQSPRSASPLRSPGRVKQEGVVIVDSAEGRSSRDVDPPSETRSTSAMDSELGDGAAKNIYKSDIADERYPSVTNNLEESVSMSAASPSLTPELKCVLVGGGSASSPSDGTAADQGTEYSTENLSSNLGVATTAIAPCYTVLQLASYGEVGALEARFGRWPNVKGNVNEYREAGTGMTALHGACRYGQLLAAQFLVEGLGAHVDAVDDQGNSALHWSCQGHHYLLVRYLVKLCGADLTIRNHAGRLAIMLVRKDEGVPRQKDIFRIITKGYRKSVARRTKVFIPQWPISAIVDEEQPD